MTPEQLQAIGQPLADRLVPGWRIEWRWVDNRDDIGGALAMIEPHPLREMAVVWVAPHPPGEDIRHSIAHELTHAAISPLTHLLEFTPAAVAIEEPIVERISGLLAGLTGQPAMARAVVSALRAPRTRVAAIRHRISALGNRAGKGRYRMMTAEQAQKALDALESGDAEAAKAVLKELIAAMAAGGGESEPPPPAREDEPGASGEAPPPPHAREDEPPAMRGANRAMQRELTSARKAATSANQSAIRLRIHEARTVDGFAISADLEREIMTSPTVDEANRLLRIARLSRAENPPPQRANSGARTQSADSDATGGEEAKDPEDLKLFPKDFQNTYRQLRAKDAKAAEHWLDNGRRQRTRSEARGRN